MDTNNKTAYFWACQLCDINELFFNSSIYDHDKITNLIININTIIGKYMEIEQKNNKTGLLEDFSEITKEALLNQIDNACKQDTPAFKSKEQRQSFGLRLWSGCISAAKTIAYNTKDGPNTPNLRRELFCNFDGIAEQDQIFKYGMECAPLFKKHHQQSYSFDGVPITSSVRNFPNDYLVDNDSIFGSFK